MHFDRQLLYLACLFGIQSASGLAIPDGSHALDILASLSSSDSSRTAHDAIKAHESVVSETAILKSVVPTTFQFGRLFPSADPRIIDSASRATLPRFSYDTAPNSISSFQSSDLTSTWSEISTLTPSSITIPTPTLDDWTDVGHQNELRQVSGASASSTIASMSSAAASSAVASGAVVQGSACSAGSGVLICSSDGTQFGYCVDGSMVWRPVAPGTLCSDGAIAFSVSVAATATTTASGSSISAATVSSVSSSLTTSKSVSATTQSSSGTTIIGGGTTRTSTGTKSQDTTTRSIATTRTQSTASTGTQSTTTNTKSTATGKTTTTGTQSSNTRTQSTDTSSQTTDTQSQTTRTSTQSTPTGMPTGPMTSHPTTGTWTSMTSMPTGPHPTNTHMTTMTSTTLTPTSLAGSNDTTPGSSPSHPLDNASVAGIASGLAAGAVMFALGGLYAWRRKKQGKPLFGARGSKRSTGSFYPKSAWLYDPPVSPNHSRAGSDAGQNLIPPPRPETSEMEAGMASPDLRAASPDPGAGRASSPLLPPPIMITRDESPDGSPGDSPRRSGGRRSRPMMSINEEDE